jgi:ferredoxin
MTGPDCLACNDCAAICKRGAISAAYGYDFGYFYKALHRGDMAPPRNF